MYHVQNTEGVCVRVDLVLSEELRPELYIHAGHKCRSEKHQMTRGRENATRLVCHNKGRDKFGKKKRETERDRRGWLKAAI